MWEVCDICGALVANMPLHQAWHYPAQYPSPVPETGTDLTPNTETEPDNG